MRRCWNLESGSKEWLAFRHARIGASEVGAVLGVNPWQTRESMLAQKRGEAPAFSGNNHTWWGSHLEIPNMQAFSMLTGIRTRHSNLTITDDRFPHLSCTLDGLYRSQIRNENTKSIGNGLASVSFFSCPPAGSGVVDMKNSSRLPKPEPAPYYYAQLQTQMLLTGLTNAILVTKVGSAEMVCHYVKADPFYQQWLVDETKRFYEEMTSGL